MPHKAEQYRPHGTRKPSDMVRDSAAVRGYGWKWSKSRINFLRAFPLCCGCDPTEERAGETIEEIQQRTNELTHANACNGIATQVDHKHAATKHEPSFYDVLNYRGRSASCHSSKTRRFDMNHSTAKLGGAG